MNYNYFITSSQMIYRFQRFPFAKLDVHPDFFCEAGIRSAWMKSASWLSNVEKMRIRLFMKPITRVEAQKLSARNGVPLGQLNRLFPPQKRMGKKPAKRGAK